MGRKQVSSEKSRLQSWQGAKHNVQGDTDQDNLSVEADILPVLTLTRDRENGPCYVSVRSLAQVLHLVDLATVCDQ